MNEGRLPISSGQKEDTVGNLSGSMTIAKADDVVPTFWSLLSCADVLPKLNRTQPSLKDDERPISREYLMPVPFIYVSECGI